MTETDRERQIRECCGNVCRESVWQHSCAMRPDVWYPPDSSLCRQDSQGCSEYLFEHRN